MGSNQKLQHLTKPRLKKEKFAGGLKHIFFQGSLKTSKTPKKIVINEDATKL